MKKNTAFLFILISAFSASVSLRQRVKRSSNTEFNSSVTPVKGPVHLKQFHFFQRLDHLNLTDDRSWPQRYWVVPTYYKKSGPAFLLINGVGPMGKGFGFSHTTLSYAQNLNAMCFSLEHRFYGRTRPVNGSLLNHLSSTQAMADIANFIKGVNKEFHLPKAINWIVFGCSYAGYLAAWARHVYPHLIHGAVASSALMIAKADYYEYEQIVEESLKSYDAKCVESIMIAFEEIALLDNSTQNIINISQMFFLDFNPDYNIAIIKKLILYHMLSIISRAVQYNDINPVSIPVVCRIMIEFNGTKLEALAEIKKMDMKREDDGIKIPSENSQGQNSVMDEDSKEIVEAWLYQRCSEFGYYSSYTNTTFLSSVKHLLLPIETEIEMLCEPFFGPNFSIENLTEKVSHTNSRYRGLDYNVCNTIFIHGSLDPWYKAGIYKKSNASLYQTIFIKGTSHCADTYSPTDKDSQELKNARNEVLKTLKSWLKKKSTLISSRN